MGDTWSMLVYHNQNTFNKNGYNDERLLKESILADIRTSNMKEAKAQYTEFFLEKNTLHDETSLLQLDEANEVDFEFISYNKAPTNSKYNEWPTE